ncbi:DUF362 domain-containing protein [Dethiobacter alkaliphilus]|uniref:4Fe-4S ferredoxin iron-sulfur binding domain protein n=1 Tax=Dethiobacter alkaliphilus AHT 1 TaxID=555088 RepID=C0GH57_DETAL|nr:DUF362 domain-containing protein [Dethiobacter alkaliphilus]EEG77359.1 4Fe-4S ferredoxin iron-sulfur binding domain protein [Dethiobacter alkaliphilus AHT 1]
MSSKVYFTDMRASAKHESLPQKVNKLFKAAGFAKLIAEDELTAVKLHFGEKGGTAFINPVLVRQVVDRVKEAGGKPFLTDTNTLYVGERANSVDHIQTAIENGFSFATVQAPIIIADGLFGKNYQEVPIDGTHFDSVKIGSDIANANGMIALSHTKGHILTGFGGAIKNLGMGCGNRGGKQMMHSSLKPKVKGEGCKVCSTCLKWCPADAILIMEETAEIDHDKCIGCGECTVVCPTRAIKIQWKSETVDVQERMAEYAWGAIKDKLGKVAFINFIMNVTPDCDCNAWSDAYIVNDVGIVASTDPVAIDQASIDLINGQTGLQNTRLEQNFAPGEDKFKGVYPETDHEAQLRHAEKLGMGSREYELIRI